MPFCGNVKFVRSLLFQLRSISLVVIVFLFKMSDILNKPIGILALNRNWFAFDLRSPKKALEDVFSISPETGIPPFAPLDLEFEKNEDGSYNLDVLVSATPVDIATWVTLPVRSCDWGITTGRGEIRLPTIIVASNYADIPTKIPKFSSDNVKKLYDYTCQATKQRLHPDELDMGHDLSRFHGGKKNWDNIAPIRKDLNRQQGTRRFSEMGWDIKFKKPKPVRVVLTTKDIKHPSQAHFVERN